MWSAGGQNRPKAAFQCDKNRVKCSQNVEIRHQKVNFRVSHDGEYDVGHAMGRTGKSSWAHKWYDQNDRCKVIVKGEPCGACTARRWAPSRVAHLLKHGVTSSTPVGKNSKTLEELWASQCPAVTETEEMLMMLARRGLPNNIVSDGYFRRRLKIEMGKNAVLPGMVALQNKLQAAVFAKIGCGTLALDIGTVHQRYLAFVLIGAGRAHFVKTIAADDPLVGGSFTSVAVAACVNTVVQELQDAGVRVAALVADNAANLQGIMPLTNKALLRCACHVLQLCVNDMSELWNSAFEIAEAAVRTANIGVYANDTRWNSKFRVLAAAADLDSVAGQNERCINDALLLLAPFAAATDFLQSDSATLLACVATIESLVDYFEAVSQSQGATPAGHVNKMMCETAIGKLQARARTLFNFPYVVLAYFSPTTDQNNPSTAAATEKVKEFLTHFEHIPEAEWAAWDLMVLDPIEGPVTPAMYTQHVKSTIMAACPCLGRAVLRLAGCSPTEAAVERCFSKMKYSFNVLRNRASTELVNASLAVASADAFFGSVALDVEEAPQAAFRAHRSESRASVAASVGSPSPTTPQDQRLTATVNVVNVAAADDADDDDAEDVDDDDEPSFTIHDGVMNTFAKILEACLEDDLRPLPIEGRTRTRRDVDKCDVCATACKDHQVETRPCRGYIVCERCKTQRRSIAHVQKVLARVTDQSKHEKHDSKFICITCRASQAAV